MTFLREATIAGSGIGLLPMELTGEAVQSKQLVRVLPRYSYVGGGLYVLWPSQTLVPRAASSCAISRSRSCVKSIRPRGE
jgi:DNA-binding transcriptional LysR family regulator